MRTVLHILAWFVMTVSAVGAEKLQFDGILVHEKTTLFALRDIYGGSAWVELGGVFLGYTIKSFDPVKETLLVVRNEESLELPLSSATSVDLARKAIATSTDELELAVLNRWAEGLAAAMEAADRGEPLYVNAVKRYREYESQKKKAQAALFRCESVPILSPQLNLKLTKARADLSVANSMLRSDLDDLAAMTFRDGKR